MNPTTNINFKFDNSYAKFPDRFYSKQHPKPVSNPSLIALNRPLAEQLGLDADALETPEGIAVLAGNTVPGGAEPIATVYAGHQFGHWNPQLGDGRAVLLGEIFDNTGKRFDIQLKGAGTTPYSRNGDGRSPVGPVIREYIVSEAMAAMGVPTTRALAAVSTGDVVFRENRLPGAVLTRVAESHLRVGTFQYFASQRDEEAIEQLTKHVIERHYPQSADAPNPALSLLEAVLGAQAKLIAHWQSIGFIHGVMNTDNASVAGLTIDYGPCAFMDAYSADTVYSSIDYQSRYAYKNQPGIAQWNTANFAQCILPLIDSDNDASLSAAQAVIDSFPQLYSKTYLHNFRNKIGLATEQDGDVDLITELLDCMEKAKADFTNTFRALSRCTVEPANTESTLEASDRELLAHFSNKQSVESWLKRWRLRHESETLKARKRVELMQNTNPAYIPRNHRIEQVIAAAEKQDYEPAHKLIAILSDPFNEQPGMEEYRQPPNESEEVKATFCGT